jgi:hypothetical protein
MRCSTIIVNLILHSKADAHVWKTRCSIILEGLLGIIGTLVHAKVIKRSKMLLILVKRNIVLVK